MAKNTTATGSVVDGVTVVHPDNIGKGLLWDHVTKTYYVAIDERMFEVDELGRLKLRVSALEDNLLKIRDDGIYQGGTARPDLQNLYVSNQGNDSNPGTREAPLRTIQAAVDKLENIPANYKIWLHEGHQFDWVYAVKSFTHVVFQVYGPTVDSQYPATVPSNVHYRGFVAKNFPRPTINVRVNERYNLIMREFLTCASIKVEGIKVDIHNKFTGFDDGSKSGWFAGVFNASEFVQIHGCIINEASKAVLGVSVTGSYRDDVIIRASQVKWIDSVYENLPHLVNSAYTAQFTIISWNNGNLAGMGEAPNHESLVKAGTPIEDMARGMRSKIHGITLVESTKSIFGMVVNWDIFANP